MKQAPNQAEPRAGPSSSTAARDVVLNYYNYYNSGDFDSLLKLFAEDAEYHDLIYLEPMKGKEEISAYFQKVSRIIPKELQFYIEDITDGDPHRAGCRWHVQVDGNEFPFSRGVSFYTVNEQGQITSGRDCVEPAIKPGSTALLGLAALTPLVKRLGPNANPAVLKKLPIKSAAMWAFYAAYIGWIMLGTAAPGNAVWQTSAESLRDVLNESINFFYVNIALNWAGITLIPSAAGHPVSEALFNFVNAWSLMFWPLMLADPNGGHVKNRFPLWIGTMFLTNVFFIPYMALRLAPDSSVAGSDMPKKKQPALPDFSPAFGWVALVVGGVSVAWALAGRPEFGALADRWDYAVMQCSGDRIFYAFVVDAALYSVFQAVLMPGAPPRLRYLPFFGLAWWLVRRCRERSVEG